MGSMSGTRTARRNWRYAVAALLVVLGVAAMHADLDVLADPGVSHDAEIAASHSHDQAAVPTPVDPTPPADPCHAASQACCVAALPTPAPRQWIALLVLAVVIGAMQVPLLQRASKLRSGIGWRPPPDLAALCVLRT